MTHRVLLGESSTFMRRLFRKTLEPLAMEVVGEVSDHDEVLAAFAANTPDLAIIDVSLAGGGVTTAQALLQSHPGAKIILCASQACLDEAKAAQQEGVQAVLQKPFHPEKLQEMAIQVVMG